MPRRYGCGTKTVNLKNADLEVPELKVNRVKKIIRYGVLYPERIITLGNYQHPLAKSKGTPNLQSLFSKKPDPSVHRHRLKRRSLNAEQVRRQEVAKNREIKMAILRKKGIALEARDIQDLARQFSVKAMERLVKILDDENASDSTILQAIGMIWDRGYGKPSVTINNLNTNADAKPSDLDARNLNKRIEETLSRVEKLANGAEEEGPSEKRPINLREYN